MSLSPDIAPDLGTRHLRALLAVAHYGNFAAASADLGISQPTLTRTIHKAERILGVALFTRTTRRVALTPAGREFLPLAERVLADLGLGLRNIRELATVERGRVAIATLMSIAHGVLPAALQAYADRYPGVAVDLHEGVQARVVEAVHGGSVDFGLGNATEIGERFAVEPIGESGCRVAMPSDHRLRRRKSVALADLADEVLIAMPTESALRRIVDGAALAAGLSLTPRYTVDQFTTIFQLVARGLGVAIVPATLLADAHPAGVASRPLAEPAAIQRHGIILRRDRSLTPAASAFIAILRDAWPEG